MAEATYLLCALASIVCALLLLRGYRTNRTHMLFWSSLCFTGLALNNLLLFIDLVIVPDADLSGWRNATALAGLMVLLFGLIWDAE
jgi:hypothetical protein